MWGSFEEALKKRNLTFTKNAPTAPLCSFRIGGSCRFLLCPSCLGELVDAVALCHTSAVPYLVVGRGSNLLFPDGVLERAVISTAVLDGVQPTAAGFVAQCGVSLPRLARLAAAAGYADLAFAAGIPGTVGGAAVMNAGAWGGEMADVVKSVKVYLPDTNSVRTVFNNELNYSYRNSVFKGVNAVILSVELAFSKPAEPDAVRREMQALSARRAASQPLNLPSAGSAFRRPSQDVPLAKIFDELGLQGLRIGNAAVSEKHAGFIVNLGGATARDVRLLLEKIADITEAHCGFRPEPEVILLE